MTISKGDMLKSILNMEFSTAAEAVWESIVHYTKVHNGGSFNMESAQDSIVVFNRKSQEISNNPEIGALSRDQAMMLAATTINAPESLEMMEPLIRDSHMFRDMFGPNSMP